MIERARRRLVADRGAHWLAPGHACQAHLADQPRDRTASAGHARPYHLPPDLAHAVDCEVLGEHACDLGLQGPIVPCPCQQACRILSLRDALVVGRSGDRQDTADRLDPIGIAVIVNESNYRRNGRSSSACAKYADALRSISLACRNSRTSRSSASTLSATSVGTSARLLLLTSAFFTHSCSVCGRQPIFSAIDTTAPIATDGAASGRKPSVPPARGLRAQTCSPSCSSWLYLLRSHEW